MTLTNWILLSGIWLGFKTGAGARASAWRWAVATAAGLGLLGLVERTTISHQTVAVWWIGCGVFLEISAWRALIQRPGTSWSDFVEMMGGALCLGFGTGLWLPLAAGMVVGGLLAVAVDPHGRRVFERMSSITLGAVGLNDFWAGMHGNLPAHHLSWLWAVPWLMAGEWFVIFSGDKRGWPSKPKGPAPQTPQKGDFAR